jgi:transcription elongation factor SPT4
MEVVPTSEKHLRACLHCKLLKTFEQFADLGCDNCPDLDLQNNGEKINQHTTSSFEGVLAMMQPEASWVAKYQRLTRKVPGVYAISVKGDQSERVKRA